MLKPKNVQPLRLANALPRLRNKKTWHHLLNYFRMSKPLGICATIWMGCSKLQLKTSFAEPCWRVASSPTESLSHCFVFFCVIQINPLNV